VSSSEVIGPCRTAALTIEVNPMSLLETAPGLVARAITSVSTFISGRLARDARGTANTTVSVHTSGAAGYRPHNVRLPPQRKWWDYVGCRMLSVLVRKSHCWNVMNGVRMTGWNYVRACSSISWVLVSLFFIY
jgi:hypothetical protein